MAQVKLDSGEIKNFLKHIIHNNKFIQETGKIPVAVEVIGEAGLGKTSVIKDVATEEALHFVKLNLSMIDELGDIIGFPVRQFQLCKEIGEVHEAVAVIPTTKIEYRDIPKKLSNGQTIMVKTKVEVPNTDIPQPALSNDCLWVDENAVEQYTKRGYNFTGKKRMTYCPPEWIADIQGGGILLLDDYNRKMK